MYALVVWFVCAQTSTPMHSKGVHSMHTKRNTNAQARGQMEKHLRNKIGEASPPLSLSGAALVHWASAVAILSTCHASAMRAVNQWINGTHITQSADRLSRTAGLLAVRSDIPGSTTCPGSAWGLPTDPLSEDTHFRLGFSAGASN